MTNWLERAKREMSKSANRLTANSDERDLTAVTAVPHSYKSENSDSSIGSNGSAQAASFRRIETVNVAAESDGIEVGRRECGMTWLTQLKKRRKNSCNEPTKMVIVGFVGTCPEPFQNSEPGNDTFTARLALFTDRGLSLADAKALAERLARRDLERDDRRLCLECLHLSGGAGSRRCSQWQKIGMINGAAIPGELVTRLQRCAGFSIRLEVMA